MGRGNEVEGDTTATYYQTSHTRNLPSAMETCRTQRMPTSRNRPISMVKGDQLSTPTRSHIIWSQ